MVGGIGEVIAPVSIVGVIAIYLHWLNGQESHYDRSDRIRRTLKGEVFKEHEVAVEVQRLEVRERSTWLYKTRKRIPFVRDLMGKTKITLRSEEKPVYLKADGIGLQELTISQQSFGDYLNDDSPPADHKMVTTSNGEVKTQIEIQSLEVAQIQNVLEKIPSYHLESLENYPGEAYVEDERTKAGAE